MFPEGTRLDHTVPIPVSEPLRTVNTALLELLRGFGAEDWHKPTVHPNRDVKDLTAHLLHGSFRRVSSIRDGYRPHTRPISGLQDLIAFIQQDNREFMTGMRRISPEILIELIARYDRELVALFDGMDPYAPGLGVAWAGEEVSVNWFDIAREYTEKWHHQQQLRDATDRSPLYQLALLVPTLETFARGFSFAYRGHEAPDGSALAITITETHEVTLGWTLRRTNTEWVLWSGTDQKADTTLSIPASTAWKLWTKSLDANEARSRISLYGDEAAIEPLLQFVAIMA